METLRYVDKVVTHVDLDAMMAYYMLFWYGRKQFIGIEKAQLDLSKGRRTKKTRTEIISARELHIDCDGDIDEHCSGSAARIGPDSSSSKIALSICGLQSDPTLSRLVGEVTRFDNEIHCPKTHLGSLLKMHMVHRQGVDALGASMAQKYIRAVHAFDSGATKPVPEQIPFREYMLSLAEDALEQRDNAYASVVELIKEEDERPERYVLGLKHIYECLWSSYGSSAIALKVGNLRSEMLLNLELLYKDQVSFHRFRAYAKSPEFQDNWFGVDVRLADGSVRRISAVAVMDPSDNPQAHVALRALGAGLTIVKSPSGNVTIQGNIDQADGGGYLDAMDEGMQSLAGMNRHCDSSSSRSAANSWQLLTCRGECPIGSHWYLAEKGWLGLFKGTRNHPAPPTKGTIAELRENARIAFDSKEVERWKARQGINDAWYEPVSSGQLFEPVSLYL